jgi:hypothetical protein
MLALLEYQLNRTEIQVTGFARARTDDCRSEQRIARVAQFG